jgi:hypothetical protein
MSEASPSTSLQIAFFIFQILITLVVLGAALYHIVYNMPKNGLAGQLMDHKLYLAALLTLPVYSILSTTALVVGIRSDKDLPLSAADRLLLQTAHVSMGHATM